ncbi:MAG: ester cyclase [Chloroflexi bacterium]|nr:ester cyclase [Chloroflexota bacterium]
MSVEENNERIVRRFLDRVMSGLSPDVVDEVVSPDVVDHVPLPGQPVGRDGVRQLAQILNATFTYLDVDIAELLQDGDRIVARWTARPARGGRRDPNISVTAIEIYRLANGAIVERWSQSNLADVLEQIAMQDATATPAVSGADAADSDAAAPVTGVPGTSARGAAAGGDTSGASADEVASVADRANQPSPIDTARKQLRDIPELRDGLTLNDKLRYCFIRSMVEPGKVKPAIYVPRNAIEDDRVFAICEADIILGEVQELTAITSDLIAAGDLPANGQDVEHAVAISGARYRWPGGVIPYRIDANLPSPSRVTDAIDHWQQRTGGAITWVPRTNQLDFVTFRRGQGCASSVGRIGGEQFVELALTCTTGNVIHEMGHVVGLWHEQSREDRESFITIVWPNIQQDMLHNFFQHITDGDDIGPYDYGSIMHYNATAFTQNGQATIVTPHGEAIGQRVGLSEGDVAAVRSLYAAQPAPAVSTNGWWSTLELSLPGLIAALRGVMDESDVRATVEEGARAEKHAAASTARAAPSASARIPAGAGTFR